MKISWKLETAQNNQAKMQTKLKINKKRMKNRVKQKLNKAKLRNCRIN